MGKENSNVFKKGLTSLIIVVAILAGVCAWFNRILIYDAFSSFLYHPSAELEEIIEDIGLTKYGKLIFGASHPSLEGREEFNSRCASDDEDISVLGCYKSDKIHIYDVDSSELVGVTQSTAAHELLHAAWARMSSSEQSKISKLLTDVYNDQKYHELLAEDLDTYPELERINELHSRVGTEIADLPAELEQHYAKFFVNQDLVVDYYDSYIEPFRELSEEIDTMSEELEALDSRIEAKTKNYYQQAEDLAKRIDEFNSCANTAGCFASDAIFSATRAALSNEQLELEDQFNEINSTIEKYNSLVNEYNENILRGESLEKIINSNAKPENVVN